MELSPADTHSASACMNLSPAGLRAASSVARFLMCNCLVSLGAPNWAALTAGPPRDSLAVAFGRS